MSEENTINIGIKVSDNGTSASTTKNVQNLKDVLDQTAVSAAKVGSAAVNKAGASLGGSTSGTGISAAESQAYATSRATGAGSTGAAARDFAKESAGLGGVVRLYATFAANIYAVGTAFDALSKAFAAERMIKASEMLSINMGANLKGIAKNLQEVTDYSISMQDAVQFTNMGVSAGIAGKQLESLVRIAKGAASALGRDTGESIKRIITGTAKQEQEILDELGIFVKAKDLYKVYATKFDIKGGADALSAQQKVIAYADGVEKAGEKWKDFASIPDPFSKFKAKGAEALQDLLVNINKLITPIISFLSESSDRLKALMILVGVILTRKALPGLKSVFSELFTFNSVEAKAAGDVARRVAINQYVDITNALRSKQAERDTLLTQPFTKPELKGVVGQAVGGLASSRGVAGGINVATLTTKLAEKDLATYTAIDSVQSKILSTINKQVAASADKSVIMKKLIDQGLVSNTSTAENLALGTEGLAIAKNLFVAITERNIALKSVAIAEAEILALTEEQLIARKSLESYGKAGGTVPLGAGSKPGAAGAAGAGIATTTAATVATDANTAANIANTDSKIVNAASSLKAAAAVVPAVTATEAFTAALAKNNIAQQKLSAAMGLGLFTQLKLVGIEVGRAFLGLFSLGTSMSAGAIAGTIFGNAITFVGVAIRALWMSLNVLLIPVMLLITAWELFGDKIKDFFGYSSALADKQEELDKQNKENTKTIGLMGAAFEVLNEKRGKGVSSIEDLMAYNNVELKAINSVIEAYAAAKAKEADIDNQTRLDKAKSAAKSRGDVFDERAYLLSQMAARKDISDAEKQDYLDLAERHQKLANSKVSDDIKVFENKQRIAAATAQLEAAKAAQSRGTVTGPSSTLPTAWAGTTDSNVVTDAENNLNNLRITGRTLIDNQTKAQQELDKATSNQFDTTSKGIAQQSSSLSVFATAQKALEKGFDDIEKRRKEIIDPSAKIRDTKVEEMSNDLKKLFDASQGNIDVTSRRAAIEKVLQIAQEKTAAGTKAHALATAALAMFQKHTITSSEDLAKAYSNLMPEFQKMWQSIDRSLRAPAPRPYTDAALKGFIDLKSAIDSADIAIKIANLTLSDTSRLDARTKALQGYSTIEITNSMAAQKALIAETEYQKAINSAKLEYGKIISKQDKEGDPKARKEEAAAATAAYILAVRNAGLVKQQTDANNKIIDQDNVINTVLGQIQKKYEAVDRTISITLATTNAALTLDKARLDSLTQLNAYSEKGLALRTASLEKTKIESDYIDTMRQAEKDRSKAQEDLAARKLDTTQAPLLVGAEANAQAEIADKYNTRVALAEIARNLANDTLDISLKTKLSIAAQNELVEKQNFALSQIEMLKTREMLTNDEYLARKRIVTIMGIEQVYARDRDIATKAYAGDIADLTAQITSFSEIGVDNPALNSQLAAIIAARDTQLDSLKRVKNAKMDQANWDAKQSDRQLAYTDIFKTAFNSMADAIVDFAKTGKLNFKNLMNSMIADLIRYEIKQQGMRWLGDGGIGGIVSKGISWATGGGTPSGQSNATTMPGLYAHGGAFDGGIQKFAMGGAFANSIVSSPTLFKFAHGTGLMGEAGPEAIMPLKRDSNGTLGVRGPGGGGNTSVVVNNYGTEKATTKETTDSKGNRRIEVVIGDLTAGEITRSGSSSQRAIRGTFGMQPQLIRR